MAAHSTPSFPSPDKHRPPQLPLPSSNFGATLNRSKSVGASRSSITSLKNQGPLSSPPTVTTFHPPQLPSSTHAGGILPSASFFRPSRPVHSHPSSLSLASNEVLSTPNPPPDQYPLTSLARRSSDRVSAGTPKDLGRFKRSKHSREPLLPITSAPPRSPTNGDLSQKSSAIRMRPSVERVFGGFSFDSFRNKSNASPLTSRLSSTEHSHALGDDYLPHKAMAHPLVEISSHGPSSYSPTTNQSFNPDPPRTYPPLSAMPVNPRIRKYQQNPSRNRFFCGGRLITGGDSPWAFLASLAVVCVISGVWFGDTCVWWWHNKSPVVAAVGAYMCLLTVSTMLATAFRDPGILPRNLDPDPPLLPISPSDEGSTRVPLSRDLKVRNDFVRVKYCTTCKTYRPPRSSHCKMCDNCVDGCDHHCQWVNNCVGRRNYTFFFAFLFSAVLTLCLVICTSALHLYLVTRRNHVSFEDALTQGIGSAIAFSLSILVIWPVTALLVYHVRLLFLNVTTIEQLRNQAHRSLEPGVKPPANPFTYGSWRSNVAEVLCRPAGLSWLDGRADVCEDKRRVNPGLDDVWDDPEGHHA